jgi:transcriptional regulator with XRE-family HTH domain
VSRQQARLGSEIARARALAGLSQAALAGRLGVHRVTVNRWERGLQSIEGHHVAALASELGAIVVMGETTIKGPVSSASLLEMSAALGVHVEFVSIPVDGVTPSATIDV